MKLYIVYYLDTNNQVKFDGFTDKYSAKLYAEDANNWSIEEEPLRLVSGVFKNNNYYEIKEEDEVTYIDIDKITDVKILKKYNDENELIKERKILNDLSDYNGTYYYYRYNSFGKIFHYTDGVATMAEMCQSYWLIDYIMSYQIKLRSLPFQSWTIKVSKNKAIFEIGDGNKIVKVCKISFTDYPLRKFQLFFTNDVLLLPSEY